MQPQWRGITLHHSAVIRHLAPVIRTVEHRGFCMNMREIYKGDHEP